MKVTIRQLQVFDAIAAEGSVTSAAAKLNITQSAASNALTDLQIVLRRKLFAHTKGFPLQITQEGRRMRPIIRSLLSEIADIAHTDISAPLQGTLVIGATAMIAETILPRLCVEFMRLYPDVQVFVDSVTVGDLFDRLTRFELETALIEIFPAVDGVELTKWRTDELVLVVAADHPLAGGGTLRIPDLAGHSWCTREADSSTTARLRYMVHEQLGQFPVAIEATSNWAVRNAVMAGGGIGCLSTAIVQHDIDNGRLVRLELEDFRFTRALSLARLKGVWRSPLARAFDAFLLDGNGATD